MEVANYQGGHTAFVMAGADRPGTKVLEVGSASGVGTVIAATSILQRRSADGSVPGSVIVGIDFSEEFVKMMKANFDQSDFA